MQVRRATAADAAAVAAVHANGRRAVLAEVAPEQAGAEVGAAALGKMWRDRLAGDWPGTVLRAEGAAAFVSFAPATDPDVSGDWFEVTNLYVDTGDRGRGVGAALLRAALGLLTADRDATVLLWVFEANTAARRVYERTGFAPDGTVMNEEVVPGVAAPKLRYVGRFPRA